MKKFRSILLVLSIQEKTKNKTVRYIERHRVGDYKVLLPSGLDEAIVESYGDNAEVYDLETVRSDVDFMGTNIRNGCAVGRLAANRFIRDHPEFDFAVVLDDDYGALMSEFTNEPMITGETLGRVIDAVFRLGKRFGFELGGYSGGAHPHRKDMGDWLISVPKKNIMNVFLIDKNTGGRGFDKILDEDVCHSIYNWHRGVATFGLEDVIRSSSQTAEMDKIDGNTKFIYQTDRSYRKSFGAVLADPRNAKVGLNYHNTKRGALWHHRVRWGGITPKIMLGD